MTSSVRSIALALGLGTLLASTAPAQVAIGLTGGVNSSTLTGSGADTLSINSITGGAGGVYANIYLGSKFSVEGQLLFSGQGFEADTVKVTQGYIMLPALLKFYIGKVNIFAGPAVSWEVSCSVDATAAVDCATSNTSMWSGIAGLGLQFGKLGVEAHYQSGFSDTFQGIDASYGVWSLYFRLALLGSR
jgi:hypothetical protein